MRQVFLALVLLAGCAGSPQKRVEKAVEAAGGFERMRAVTSARITSKGSVAGFLYTTRQHLRRPADWRWDMEYQGGGFTTWVLGAAHEVTVAMVGRTLRPGKNRSRSAVIHGRAMATSLSPGLLLRPNVTLENAPPAEIDGATHRVVDAYFDGEPRPIRYFFSGDGLLRRLEYEVWDEEALRWVTAVHDLADHKTVDGIRIAHRTTVHWGDRMLIEDTIESVELNPTIPADVFAPPAPQAPPPVELRVEADRRCAVHAFRGPPGEQAAALGRVMAWIAAAGGQPAGPPDLLFRHPTDHIHPERNEVVIHVPVTMERAPADGEIALKMRGSFLFAFVRYEGPPMGAVSSWADVFEWCEENGYERIGARRMRMVEMDGEQGRAVIEVGFPVRKKQTWR